MGIHISDGAVAGKNFSLVARIGKDPPEQTAELFSHFIVNVLTVCAVRIQFIGIGIKTDAVRHIQIRLDFIHGFPIICFGVILHGAAIAVPLTDGLHIRNKQKFVAVRAAQFRQQSFPAFRRQKCGFITVDDHLPVDPEHIRGIGNGTDVFEIFQGVLIGRRKSRRQKQKTGNRIFREQPNHFTRSFRAGIAQRRKTAQSITCYELRFLVNSFGGHVQCGFRMPHGAVKEQRMVIPVPVIAEIVAGIVMHLDFRENLHFFPITVSSNFIFRNCTSWQHGGKQTAGNPFPILHHFSSLTLFNHFRTDHVDSPLAFGENIFSTSGDFPIKALRLFRLWA